MFRLIFSAILLAIAAGMARLTPEEAAEKWARNAAAASGDFRQGVERVTVAPGQAAAAKFDKWRNGIQENADKWRRNTAAVSLTAWQERTANLGSQRYAQGVQEKKDKMGAFMREFLPYQDTVRQRVQAMDDSTPEARIQRAVAMMRGNMGFRRRSGGGS